jgi:hypothetical protein
MLPWNNLPLSSASSVFARLCQLSGNGIGVDLKSNWIFFYVSKSFGVFAFRISTTFDLPLISSLTKFPLIYSEKFLNSDIPSEAFSMLEYVKNI